MADKIAVLVMEIDQQYEALRTSLGLILEMEAVQIFFTGSAVKLGFEPDFARLVGISRLSICDVGFRANGFHGREEEVPGVGFKDFATQARNAEMVAECDRYLVM